jgi:hypothetical protein
MGITNLGRFGFGKMRHNCSGSLNELNKFIHFSFGSLASESGKRDYGPYFRSLYNDPSSIRADSCSRSADSLFPADFERISLYICSARTRSPFFLASAASSILLCLCTKFVRLTRRAPDSYTAKILIPTD